MRVACERALTAFCGRNKDESSVCQCRGKLLTKQQSTVEQGCLSVGQSHSELRMWREHLLLTHTDISERHKVCVCVWTSELVQAPDKRTSLLPGCRNSLHHVMIYWTSAFKIQISYEYFIACESGDLSLASQKLCKSLTTRAEKRTDRIHYLTRQKTVEPRFSSFNFSWSCFKRHFWHQAEKKTKSLIVEVFSIIIYY